MTLLTNNPKDVNRDWTPEERAQVILEMERIDSDPALSLEQKLAATIALIKEWPR